MKSAISYETPCECCAHELQAHMPGTSTAIGGCNLCQCFGFVSKGAKYCLNRDCRGSRCQRERAKQQAADEFEGIKINAWHNRGE